MLEQIGIFWKTDWINHKKIKTEKTCASQSWFNHPILLIKITRPWPLKCGSVNQNGTENLLVVYSSQNTLADWNNFFYLKKITGQTNSAKLIVCTQVRLLVHSAEYNGKGMLLLSTNHPPLTIDHPFIWRYLRQKSKYILRQNTNDYLEWKLPILC